MKNENELIIINYQLSIINYQLSINNTMFSEKDDKLSQLLKTYENPKSSWDLEDRIMKQIHAYEKQKNAKNIYLKFAWVFFGVGLILGSLITSFWFSPTKFVFHIPSERLFFPLQIVIVFALLLFFNELLKTTLLAKKKK